MAFRIRYVVPQRKRSSFFSSFWSVLTGSTSLRSFWPAGGASSVPPVNASTSWGGITLTPELSLTLSAVWGCVWRYANTISTLPLHLMQTGPQNTATMATDHPLYVILHDKPHRDMSASKFWQAMVAGMMVWGVAYARKLYSTDGKLIGLRPLRPEFMTAYMTDAGELRYRYQANKPNMTAETEDFAADALFVVIDRTLDGYSGLSRLEYARNSLGLAVAADRAANLTYRKGLRASGILTIGQWLKPGQREAYQSHLDSFMGTGDGDSDDKQYGVMVAENATKFESLSLKPQDVELLASRRFSVEDVCRWYDVPPVLVGHAAEGQTMWGTGIEQIVLGWLKLGLAPVIRTIEQEIWRQLLTPAEQQKLFAEFNLDALLRGDSAARASMYSAMAQNGVYTRNEIRARENLPPVPGGDIATVQSNLVQLDKLGTVAPSATIPPNP